MHAGAPRMNGGIGFAVDGPTATIEAKPASNIEIEDARRFPMTASELQQLRGALLGFSQRLELKQGAAIRIEGAMQTHVGMGSATAIRLAALQALALVSGRTVARGALVAASGRGGTSGIGVNSYFDGGLVCDLGRSSDGSHFSPSSQVRATSPPLALPSVKMPDWPVLLCIPSTIRTKTQGEEVAFFARTAPLPAAATFETSYIALFELYAAAAEADFGAFCRGIEHMQRTEWKQAERAEYGEPGADAVLPWRPATPCLHQRDCAQTGVRRPFGSTGQSRPRSAVHKCVS
jgi:beta-ribofuranosylaminobenzene 5'-phosphate synthase